jgi:RNA polymerase sigma-70 factor (ECF subfamily)
MLALQRLSPLERAAFLLHDVFAASFDEIAETIGRDPAACRQLASRARSHVRAARPRFAVSKEHGMEIAAAFFQASRNGDMAALRSLLVADVSLQSDGGGKVPAGLRPFIGIEDVMKLHASLARFFAKGMSRLMLYGFVNGLPGFVTIEQGGVLQTTALAIEEGRITGIYVTRNPEKLRHLDAIH